MQGPWKCQLPVTDIQVFKPLFFLVLQLEKEYVRKTDKERERQANRQGEKEIERIMMIKVF